MATMKTLEVWVLVDQDGDYEVGTVGSDAATRYDESVGADGERGMRMVKLLVTLRIPEVIEVAVNVPDTEGVPTVSVG